MYDFSVNDEKYKSVQAASTDVMEEHKKVFILTNQKAKKQMKIKMN